MQQTQNTHLAFLSLYELRAAELKFTEARRKTALLAPNVKCKRPWRGSKLFEFALFAAIRGS
jgi:hypothetical protein